MTNGTKQEYSVNRTELFGGDVRLQNEVGTSRCRDRVRARSRSRSLSDTFDEDEEEDEDDVCDMTPTIDAQGELAGRDDPCSENAFHYF